MWPFSLIKWKNPRINHDLDRIDQDSGGETMITKGELNRLKINLQKEKLKLEHARDMAQLQAELLEAQQDLEDLQAENEPEPEKDDSLDKMMMGLLMGVMAPKGSAQIPAVSNDYTAPASVNTPTGEPSNEELRTLWHKIPKNYQDQALKQLKK